MHQLFRLLPGQIDEGRDLLADGLDATQQAAYDRLLVELDRLDAALTYGP